MMTTTVEITTNGPDDAEATARTLEKIAQQIRTAGGDPLDVDGETTFTGGPFTEYGAQTTNWTVRASA